MTSFLSAISVGRRRRWLVSGVALVLIAVAAPLGTKFQNAQQNDPSAFLPGGAESVRSLDQQRRFPSGAETPAVTVFHRDGGLTAADRQAIATFADRMNSDPVAHSRRTSPPLPSRDGTSALVVTPLAVSGDADALTSAVDEIRSRAHAERTPGFQVEVSGPAGYSTDAIKVFSGINTTLFAAALVLVLVLLVLIYRSPVFWIIPILSVVAAEQLLRAAGYALTEVGVTVNGQTAGIALDPGVRRGHRLRPALGRPLPGGAATQREHLSGDAPRARRCGTRDRRIRRNRRRGAAGRDARGGQLHGWAGSVVGGGRGTGHDLIPDAAAGAASDRRATRLLAVRPSHR